MCIFCVLICSQKAEVFRLVLRSEDELFHVSLYDWLFSMNLTDRLLEVCIKGYSTVLMLRPLDEKTSHRLLDSLVVECRLRVWEVLGSIPRQGPRHTKDVIKMVPVVPLFGTQH